MSQILILASNPAEASRRPSGLNERDMTDSPAVWGITCASAPLSACQMWTVPPEGLSTNGAAAIQRPSALTATATG